MFPYYKFCRKNVKFIFLILKIQRAMNNDCIVQEKCNSSFVIEINSFVIYYFAFSETIYFLENKPFIWYDEYFW